jgi:carbonic anhydrase
MRRFRTSILVLLIVVFTAISCEWPLKKEQKQELDNSLSRLVKGNARFLSGRPAHPDETRQRIRNLKGGQKPFVVIVSCSDSRVPPELVFDQGFGDIFSVRTAGNIIGDYELGSIEYAVEHLGCSLVLVLGHENCGAVNAYIQQDGEKHQDHIQKLVDYIGAEIEQKQLPDSAKHNIEMAVMANIRYGVHLLKQSEPIIKEMHAQKKIQIAGAIYDLDSGKVTVIE